MIHPTAIVDPRARLAPDVEVGAWSIVGAEVEIGPGSTIGAHVIVHGPARIGRDTRIHPYCVIGTDPQDKKFTGRGPSALEIGDRNTIREYCSINRGTAGGGGVTRIGNDNWIMAYVHIAHDCQIGNGAVFANNATLAGHVSIGDYASLGGFTGVHQFCRVGAYAFTAIASIVVKDVPPFLLVAGNTAQAHGLNRIGLRRHRFDTATVAALKSAYRSVYRNGLTREEALDELLTLAAGDPRVLEFREFILQSTRGIVRAVRRANGDSIDGDGANGEDD